MNNILRLLRPWQWSKNFFVMLPLFFGGELFNTKAITSGIITMLAFCFTASAVYCFNDIFDSEADRRHPVKCNRPIASGKISKTKAYILMTFMIILAVATLFFLPTKLIETATVIGVYFVMNICYCGWLKRFAIIDVCVVATGFVLRILAGGVATDVTLSKWIVLMTFLLTLFLSFAKRRDDVLRMMATGEAPRQNTSKYNLTFIDQAITVIASVTLVCYIMYTVSPDVNVRSGSQYLYLTSVFVLLGLLRYLQVALVFKKSGDPTHVLLTDHFLQATLAAWLLSFIIIIYLI
jgi:decaprenyl-phosphate phosphoribosyltransferase